MEHKGQQIVTKKGEIIQGVGVRVEQRTIVDLERKDDAFQNPLREATRMLFRRAAEPGGVWDMARLLHEEEAAEDNSGEIKYAGYVMNSKRRRG